MNADTIKQEAEQIVGEVRLLGDADAVDVIGMRLTSFAARARNEGIGEAANTVEVICTCYAKSKELYRVLHSSECPIFRTDQIKSDILALKSQEATDGK